MNTCNTTKVRAENGKVSTKDLISSLLSTLNEDVFFCILSSFLKEKYSNFQIKIFKTLDSGSAEQIVSNELCLNETQRVRLSKGLGISGHVIKTKKPYFSNNVESDPLSDKGSGSGSITAELCFPIMSSNTVMATLNMQSTSPEHKFDAEFVQGLNDFFKEIERPLVNLHMYLTAKRLNETLFKQVQQKEEEIQQKNNRFYRNNRKIRNIEMVGTSEAFKKMMEVVDRLIKDKDLNAVLQGPSGSGKELIARKIHYSSERKDFPYIVVNCNSLDERQLDEELFGIEHKKNDGSVAKKAGLLEMANLGTIYLDQVESLPEKIQYKLLRFIEDEMGQRIGCEDVFRSKVRLIASTDKDLRKEVEESHFRGDLFYTLGGLVLRVPTLKERRSDILALARHIVAQYKCGVELKEITKAAVKCLENYPWPGNIRELKNVIESAFALSEGKYIDETHLPEYISKYSDIEIPEKEEFVEMTLQQLEKKHIYITLKHLQGNKTKAAKVLGITVKTLYNKLNSYTRLEA